jgi:hypothetical protein
MSNFSEESKLSSRAHFILAKTGTYSFRLKE